MNAIRRFVVATLLAVWCFPAASMANPSPRAPAPIVAEPTAPIPATSGEASGTEVGTLAAREQKARELQDFKGGRVYIYLGSGVVVVLLVVLLVLLLV
ncbi:MAG TPA: hypothetical protein VHO67_03640 [Polyangia bacterium]|nr:hypothetical protein [Polyangia bacterium]